MYLQVDCNVLVDNVFGCRFGNVLSNVLTGKNYVDFRVVLFSISRVVFTAVLKRVASRATSLLADCIVTSW